MIRRLARRLGTDGEFGKNVLVLMTGTTVAQAIPIAFSPILTRIYGPEDFGVLAVFVAVTTVLGSIASARYEMAVMIAEQEEDAVNLAFLCLAIAVGVAGGALLLVALLGGPFTRMVDAPQLGGWLYLVPVAVLLVGLFNALNYYNSRHKNYRTISRATASKSVAVVGVQVTAGLAGAGIGGLVAGHVAGTAASNSRLIGDARRLSGGERPTLSRMAFLAKRYRKFPLFSMPAILANTLSLQLTNILMTFVYSVSTLGFYSLVQRVLGLPSSLVGQSVGQVFFQRATQEKNATGSALQVYTRTSQQLFLLSAPVFLVIFFIAPDLFSVVFGSEWRVAGEYARILVPLFCIRFVVTAVSVTGSVFEAQGVSLVWQIALLVLTVGTLYLAHVTGASVEAFLLMFTVVSGAHYLLLWFIMRAVSTGKPLWGSH